MSPRPTERSPFGILTGLFMRRLMDNDTLSPHADRHESFALLCGALVTLGVFLTFFLCVNYLAAFVQLPGPAALSALSDRFLLIAGSITIGGLMALLTWDGLALEPRDAVILGPLPVSARTIGRAKLAAALLFASLATFLLNAAPSVLYPALLTVNMRGIRATALVHLMAGHALSTMLAGMLGFVGILALRGTLRTVLGRSLFPRVSSWVQATAIVVMTTAILLSPTVKAGDVRAWVAQGRAPLRPIDAALWYLGLNESLAGHVLADTRVVLPLGATHYPTEADAPARAAYRGLLPPFRAFARRGWWLLGITIAVAVVTFLLTNRRLPEHESEVGRPSRLRVRMRGVVENYVRQSPGIEAGFYFALQVLTRSRPHRALMAASLALALTHGLIVLLPVVARGVAIDRARVFAMSTGCVLAVLSGYRLAARLPGAPSAQWLVRVSWPGDEREYVVGVKRAGLLLTIGCMGVLFPLHVALLGAPVAMAHAVIGVLCGAVVLGGLFLPYCRPPFVCGYVPLENPNLTWPAALLGLLALTHALARLEQWAFQAPIRGVALVGALGLLWWALEVSDGRRRQIPFILAFDERPAPATQRLGLYDHVMRGD